MSRGPARGSLRALAGVLLAAVLAGPGQAAVGATASTAAGTSLGASSGAGAGAAPGEEDALRLSADGATWATGLPASLFGPDALVVPGATVARDLWVRNDGPTAARVLVDLAADVDPAVDRPRPGAHRGRHVVARDRGGARGLRRPGARPSGTRTRGVVRRPLTCGDARRRLVARAGAAR